MGLLVIIRLTKLLSRAVHAHMTNVSGVLQGVCARNVFRGFSEFGGGCADGLPAGLATPTGLPRRSTWLVNHLITQLGTFISD